MSEFSKSFSESGNDYDAAISRVAGDEALLESLYLMFVADDNWSKVNSNVESGNSYEAFRAAHSLKGSCGMLGMTALFEKIYNITEYLRNGDIASAKRALPEASAEYNKIIDMIKRYIQC